MVMLDYDCDVGGGVIRKKRCIDEERALFKQGKSYTLASKELSVNDEGAFRRRRENCLLTRNEHCMDVGRQERDFNCIYKSGLVLVGFMTLARRRSASRVPDYNI